MTPAKYAKIYIMPVYLKLFNILATALSLAFCPACDNSVLAVNVSNAIKLWMINKIHKIKEL